MSMLIQVLSLSLSLSPFRVFDRIHEQSIHTIWEHRFALLVSMLRVFSFASLHLNLEFLFA